jgi:hypothetical protein
MFVITINVFSLYSWRTALANAEQSGATLLLPALLGGGIGARMGMKVWQRKTMRKKFKCGIPAIMLIQIALMVHSHMN